MSRAKRCAEEWGEAIRDRIVRPLIDRFGLLGALLSFVICPVVIVIAWMAVLVIAAWDLDW